MTTDLAVVSKAIQPTTTRLADYTSADAVLFEVKSQADLALATEAINDLKHIAKELELHKQSVTGPIQKGLNTVRSWFSVHEKQVAGARALWDSKIVTYLKAVREEQAQIRVEAQAAIARKDVEAAKEAIVRFEPPPKAVGLSVKDEWDFEVVDITKINPRYTIVSFVEVRAEMRRQVKQGVDPELEGIRFFKRNVVRATG